MNLPRVRGVAAVLAVTALVLAACNTPLLPDPPELPPPVIGDFVESVAVVGQDSAKAELQNKPLQAGAGNGPTIEVAGVAKAVNGGSTRDTVKASAPFGKLRLGIKALPAPSASAAAPTPSASRSGRPRTQAPSAPAEAASANPERGYFEIALPSAVAEADIVVSLKQNLPSSAFVFFYAAVDASGVQGVLGRQAVDAVQVGTGEVQVSVSWDAASDVDLHVVDASGEEIYYDHDRSASGGELDLDSNAECEIDNTNNENITFTDAPPGTYTVRVDYWSNCDEAKTNYVVTVRVGGQPAKTYNGTFTGKGDEGEKGAGKEIATFTVT
ncbi:YfaP family protein [Virgisporangium aliadipatigenens]|uniref:YfaP family protein n=1 Tax=Virgisporangium aliadipatigenens TaxID=741659 RepID=UPI0019430A2D|nr:pre-peptidase C-terminal domain-containing protein [Virgisporangium aliadipatigenens]